DIGAHIAKALWGYRTLHAGETFPLEGACRYFGRIYTEATLAAADDDSVQTQIHHLQTMLEARDPDLTDLWTRSVHACLTEIQGVFNDLGMTFDRIYTESEVEARGKVIAQELVQKGIAKRGERNAIIVDLEDEHLGVF